MTKKQLEELLGWYLDPIRKSEDKIPKSIKKTIKNNKQQAIQVLNNAIRS